LRSSPSTNGRDCIRRFLEVSRFLYYRFSFTSQTISYNTNKYDDMVKISAAKSSSCQWSFLTIKRPFLSRCDIMQPRIFEIRGHSACNHILKNWEHRLPPDSYAIRRNRKGQPRGERIRAKLCDNVRERALPIAPKLTKIEQRGWKRAFEHPSAFVFDSAPVVLPSHTGRWSIAR